MVCYIIELSEDPVDVIHLDLVLRHKTLSTEGTGKRTASVRFNDGDQVMIKELVERSGKIRRWDAVKILYPLEHFPAYRRSIIDKYTAVYRVLLASLDIGTIFNESTEQVRKSWLPFVDNVKIHHRVLPEKFTVSVIGLINVWPAPHYHGSCVNRLRKPGYLPVQVRAPRIIAQAKDVRRIALRSLNKLPGVFKKLDIDLITEDLFRV